MKDSEKREKEILVQLITDLQSDNDANVLGAIKKARDKGSVSIIPVLLDVYSQKGDKIKMEIKNLLGELKDTRTLPALIDSLKNADDNVSELILSSIWSSNLDASEYIPSIVEAACTKGYMTAFEALTVLENLEGPFQEEKLSEAKIHLNEYFSKEKKNTDELIKSILKTIRLMDNSITG